jgi:hypothetical protein
MAARAVVSEGARVPGGLLFDLVRHVPPQEADMPGDLLSYTAYGTGRSSETGWAAGYAAPGRRIVLAEFWTTSDEFVVEPAVERHGASVCVTWPVGDEGRNEKFEFTGVEWLRVVPAVECMIWDIQDAYDRLVEVVPDVALSDLPGVIGPSDGGRLFLMCLGGFGAVKVVARSWSRTG